jgi:hypothetical protein
MSVINIVSFENAYGPIWVRLKLSYTNLNFNFRVCNLLWFYIVIVVRYKCDHYIANRYIQYIIQSIFYSGKIVRAFCFGRDRVQT